MSSDPFEGRALRKVRVTEFEFAEETGTGEKPVAPAGDGTAAADGKPSQKQAYPEALRGFAVGTASQVAGAAITAAVPLLCAALVAAHLALAAVAIGAVVIAAGLMAWAGRRHARTHSRTSLPSANCQIDARLITFASANRLVYLGGTSVNGTPAT